MTEAFRYSLSSDCFTSFNIYFLQAYAAVGMLNRNYANILLMLLCGRRGCDHYLLKWQWHFLKKCSDESTELLGNFIWHLSCMPLEAFLNVILRSKYGSYCTSSMLLQ
ncbi:hypothetical protein V6N13_080408 [Hibiscus sabdariffa]